MPKAPKRSKKSGWRAWKPTFIPEGWLPAPKRQPRNELTLADCERREKKRNARRMNAQLAKDPTRAFAKETEKCAEHFGPLPCVTCAGLAAYAERRRAPTKGIHIRKSAGELYHGFEVMRADREARAPIGKPRPFFAHREVAESSEQCRVCGDYARVIGFVLFPKVAVRKIFLCSKHWLQLRSIGWRFTGRNA